MKHRPTLSLALAAAIALGGASLVRAEAQKAPAADSQAAPPADKMMEGCQAKADGGACCGSAACQQNKQDVAAKAEGEAAGGCPCQRAKQARQAREAKP